MSKVKIEQKPLAITLSGPKIVKREQWNVVGAYAINEKDENWGEASAAFDKRKHEIKNRKDDTVLAFLYRPNRDHPEIPESVMACFMGVEVTDLDNMPTGLATTRFPKGEYAVVECKGDTEYDAAMGIGPAVDRLLKWTKERGYGQGDEGSIACSHEKTSTPPFRWYVYGRFTK